MSFPSAIQSLRSGLRARSHSATTLPCFHIASTQRLQPVVQRCCRLAHTVRVILTDDLPNGKSYKGEVLHVKSGFARNYLIPGKIALYATTENFQKLDMKDPDMETEDQRAERLAREAMSDEGAEELKAADILKHYLRNKVVRQETKAVGSVYTSALYDSSTSRTNPSSSCLCHKILDAQLTIIHHYPLSTVENISQGQS